MMSFYSEFAEHYEAVFPFREAVLAFVTAHLEQGRQRILDLGCGPGHYAGRLAELGHEVVGLDLDPQMIVAARSGHPAADFICRDMSDLEGLAPPAFDLAFCLGNVAAHLPRERVPRFLERLAAILRPGGIWMLQTVNWDRILQRARHRFSDRRLAGDLVFEREYRDIGPRRLRFLTRLHRSGRTVFAGEVELFPARAGEYLRWHEAAGFVCEGHYGDYDRRVFDSRTAPASVFVFRRRLG
jgi:SAM-dependent methyltransferase